MRTLLKVCGLMNQKDVEACCTAGVDFLGFVTEYPVPVPWNLFRKTAKALLPHVSAPAKSCIVTGGEIDKIISLADDLRPNYLQLHFWETLNDTKQILRACRPMGVQVIKTIPLSPADRMEQFGSEDPARCAKLLEDAGVFAVLVDSRAPSNAAGHGQSADLSLFTCIRDAVNIPVILAGGITPENGAHIMQTVHPEIIDVMTGVEIAPGTKDIKKVKALTAIVHASDCPK